MNTTDKDFYIYAWYYKDTDKVFYIGKGHKNRMYDTVGSRNNYFKNIINKEKDNIDVKKIYDNLTEEDSYLLERKLIHEYWNKGECKANFHEGGCGGNHGNYGASMKEKLSKFASTRTGSKNSMYHHIYTDEQRKHLSDGQNGIIHGPMSETTKKKLSDSNKKFWNSELGKEKIKEIVKKYHRPENWGIHNAEAHCLNNYIISLNNINIFESRYYYEILSFCKNNYNISRTIVDKIINNSWNPKFKKHQNLKNLKIIIEFNKFKSVSTNPDECKDVE